MYYNSIRIKGNNLKRLITEMFRKRIGKKESMQSIKPLQTILFILLANLFVYAQPSSEQIYSVPTNLNFETDKSRDKVSGWKLTPVCAPTDSFTSTSENPFQGNSSGLIKLGAEKSLGAYCIIVQSFDAANFRGKKVRLRSAIKTENKGKGQAQMWFRVDRKTSKGNGLTGFFDNMGDRPVTSDKWGYYDIEAVVSPDAATLNIGFLIYGSGQTWVDDISFEITSDTKTINEPPSPLSARGLSNIIIFSRLMGYVRHFHPSDQAAKTDWDTFTVNGIRQVEGAKNNKELLDKLNLLFKPVAPSILIYSGTKSPPPAPPTSASKRLMWRHLSFRPRGGSLYKSERIELKTNDDVPDSIKADLGDGLSAIIPIVVGADSNGTLPHPKLFLNISEEKPELFSGNNRAVRLANVALAWNVFQHFYPYFDVVKVDWMNVLPEMLKMAATDKNEEEFVKTLQKLVNRLQDGHGIVFGNSGFIPPIKLGLIDGKVLVTFIEKPIEGLNLGDAIISVNGQPIEQALLEEGKLVSAATEQWKYFQIFSNLLSGQEDEIINLEIEPWQKPGQKSKISLKCDTKVDWNYGLSSINDKQNPKVSEIEPGIFYLNIDQINDKDFSDILPKLEQAKGIIFDFRAYPKLRDSRKFLSHLSDKPLKSASWLVPLVTEPDRRNMKFDGNREWEVSPKAPFLKAKKVFITDGRAISAAETYLGIVENYKLGEIVGETTAGTNGNINIIELPGDYQIYFTGMKVLKQDGSRHHGVGISPTVKVTRTRAGIAAGKDEFLEKAIEIVKN
jgi:hypothetical protein